MPGSMELRGARILVVDDLDSDARLIKAMLEGSGFSSVTTLTDPFAARDLHAANRYDLVILDVMMPGMDGFAVLAALESISPECPVPVIVVTAEPDHMERALEAGARDFIGKPVRMVELLPRVRNALQLGMLLRERTDDLVEARERYQALVEQSIAGIYIIEDGRFTYANPRLCAWLGYTHDELIGMESIKLVAEVDRPRLIEMRARRDAGDLTVMTASFRMLRKDGLIVHLAFDARMMELRGRPVLFGVAQDVTEREHARELLIDAETHYRALVEQSIVGIYLFSERRVLYANPRLCEIIGYSLAELADKSLRDVIVAEDHPLIDAVMDRRRNGEMGAIALECRARRRDGSVVDLRIESKVIDLVGRKAAIGVVQDVTLRRLAQHELDAANRRLRTLSERVLGVQEEERRRISRELHDEIGQSLVALGIGLHRLGPHVDASHRNLVSECLNVADAVREKVREISVNLHPPHLDQLGLQDALRWLVSRQAEMTGVRIKCRFCGVEKLRIAPAVEAACYRICQEALNNATRHSRAARIVVELAVRRRELFVKIMDDGVGFDQAAQRQALLTSGSMGLVSMEERARLAGGRLEVRTAPAAGTSVCALFPLDARAAESAASRERI